MQKAPEHKPTLFTTHMCTLPPKRSVSNMHCSSEAVSFTARPSVRTASGGGNRAQWSDTSLRAAYCYSLLASKYVATNRARAN